MYLIEQAAVKSQAPFGVAAKRFIGRDARGDNVFRLKTRVHMRERPETANEKSGRNNKERSKTDLCGR